MAIEIPEKLQVLFQPSRLKVVWGGRGGGKSQNIARILLIMGMQQKLRVLCTREIQKSIKESVHHGLAEQVQQIGAGSFYDVLDTEIRGRNGTEFIFTGLAAHTVESLKSYDGINICWVEEGQTVSRRSWDILTPTIRAEGSEIWVSLNPELDTDETWVRFVAAPPPYATVIQINYNDNPWFPAVLEQERRHCEVTRPEDYRNIWLGECRTSVEGAIYAREVQATVSQGRICPVPYDPRLKVHAVFDLGWADSMAIGLVQKGVADVRVIGYIEESMHTLDWYAAKLRALPYNWGSVYLPHDGFSRDYKSGKSADDILRAFNFQIKPVPSLSVEAGIKAVRMLFPRVYFDTAATPRLLECLKRYRRHVNRDGVVGDPLHDTYSDGADMFRYVAVSVESMSNEDGRSRQALPMYRPSDAMMGTLG